MKSRINISILILLVSLFAFTQAAKSQEKEKHEGNNKEFIEWKELKDFHEVISKTFHPMEEGNLKPIRERSAELNSAAGKLSASKIPADLNRAEVVSAVKELNDKTKKLYQLIQAKGSDEKVKALLTSVHDSFHKIVGLCSKEEHSEK